MFYISIAGIDLCICIILYLALFISCMIIEVYVHVMIHGMHHRGLQFFDCSLLCKQIVTWTACSRRHLHYCPRVLHQNGVIEFEVSVFCQPSHQCADWSSEAPQHHYCQCTVCRSLLHSSPFICIAFRSFHVHASSSLVISSLRCSVTSICVVRFIIVWWLITASSRDSAFYVIPVVAFTIGWCFLCYVFVHGSFWGWLLFVEGSPEQSSLWIIQHSSLLHTLVSWVCCIIIFSSPCPPRLTAAVSCWFLFIECCWFVR